MATFAGDMLIARVCEQFLETKTTLAMCSILCTLNGIVATDYIEWCTCDGNFYPIEISIIYEISYESP